MIEFDKYKMIPSKIYWEEEVDFDNTGHAKLSKIPEGDVYVLNELHLPFKVHYSSSVIYCKKFSNKKSVQVIYPIIENCRVVEIKSEDYSENAIIEIN